MVTLRRNKSGAVIKTVTGDGGVSFPPGLYSHVSVENAAGLAAYSVGTTPGGTELVDNEPVSAGIPETFSLGLLIKVTTTLYFSGITSPTTNSLYKI